MKRYFDLDQASGDRTSSTSRLTTVGFFDGVHRGHRRILRDLEDWAAETDREPAVVTFDRHPQSVLGGHPPVPIISLEHRLLLLEREGIAATLVLRFDRELASWSPERFVRDVLARALGADRLLLGFDGAFGRDRTGTYDYLRTRSAELGLEVRRSAPEFVQGERVSSTLVRDAVRRGDLPRAEQLLGRRFSVLGRVVHGEHRGKEIGFPTANLDIGEAAVLPRGVYFADTVRLRPSLVDGKDPAALDVSALPRLPSVVNVGRCPTFTGDGDDGEAFDPARDKVEVHILDFDGDLYGTYIEVFIDHKHRNEVRFGSVEALVAQIRLDVEARRGFRRSTLSA